MGDEANEDRFELSHVSIGSFLGMGPGGAWHAAIPRMVAASVL
jgi:hypothetical protein